MKKFALIALFALCVIPAFAQDPDPTPKVYQSADTSVTVTIEPCVALEFQTGEVINIDVKNGDASGSDDATFDCKANFSYDITATVAWGTAPDGYTVSMKVDGNADWKDVTTGGSDFHNYAAGTHNGQKIRMSVSGASDDGDESAVGTLTLTLTKH